MSNPAFSKAEAIRFAGTIRKFLQVVDGAQSDIAIARLDGIGVCTNEHPVFRATGLERLHVRCDESEARAKEFLLGFEG